MHVCYIFYYSRRSGPKHEREGLSLGVCIVNVLLHLQADGPWRILLKYLLFLLISQTGSNYTTSRIVLLTELIEL